MLCRRPRALSIPNCEGCTSTPSGEPDHPRWVEAMTVLVKNKKHFRWHDSGDIQSVAHLKKIFEVCNNTPATMHWLPTQERKYLPLGSYPANLVIRLSNAKNNTKPGNAWTHWSTVVDEGGDCPASRAGQCMRQLSTLLVQRGEACHIPQTLSS